MTAQDFFNVFKESQEIGRDVTDQEVAVFYKNGEEVGEARTDRRTSQTDFRILDREKAEMTVYWYTLRPLMEKANKVRQLIGELLEIVTCDELMEIMWRRNADRKCPVCRRDQCLVGDLLGIMSCAELATLLRRPGRKCPSVCVKEGAKTETQEDPEAPKSANDIDAILRERKALERNPRFFGLIRWWFDYV